MTFLWHCVVNEKIMWKPCNMKSTVIRKIVLCIFTNIFLIIQCSEKITIKVKLIKHCYYLLFLYSYVYVYSICACMFKQLSSVCKGLIKTFCISTHLFYVCTVYMLMWQIWFVVCVCLAVYNNKRKQKVKFVA